jgi:two-component system cell cycle sensor histidine kinase/response regulator CckA
MRSTFFADHNEIFYRCVEDCFEPIMLTDIRGVLRYVNPAWCLTYGYDKEEALGKNPRLLRSELQDDQFYKSMWAQITNPDVGFWRGEVTNKSKNGALVPVLLTITPYREASGEVIGYMGIAVDLSDQKRLESQILQQDRLASVGMLASGLAHEIGNPLGVIRGRAELLANQVRGNEAATKNAEVILSQIDRISNLIQSLLRVSRVPERILLRAVDVKQAVGEVATLMAEVLRKENIELKTIHLDRSILCEPSQFQQLLLNLIINATHAIEEQKKKGPSPVAGDKHFIEVSAFDSEDGRYCDVNVRDSGCGISKANLAKLFQPFFTTKAAGQGTGMGLAVVSKLVDEMQGQVTASSEGPGLGAAFKLRFKKPEASAPN